MGIRVQRRKKWASAARVQPSPATRPHERWSLDVLSDSLADGRRFRVLTIVDHGSRVSAAIAVDNSVPGERVVAILERLTQTVGTPERIAVDNGEEFRPGIHLHGRGCLGLSERSPTRVLSAGQAHG